MNLKIRTEVKTLDRSKEIESKKVHEPLFHIVKRDAIVWWKAWLIRIAAVFAALMVVAVITLLITGQNPLEMYKALVYGAVGTTHNLWVLAKNTAFLLIVAVALTPAFKMKFWNIGGQGQILVGGIAVTACLKFLTGRVPVWVLFLTMIVSSMVAGAIWALIPGVFKAFLGTNETLFTLMMNYIAVYLVEFVGFKWSVQKGKSYVGSLNASTHTGWLELPDNEYILSIVIVLALTIIAFVYLSYTKHGYEISVVGGSENTARYIGINVKKVIIRTVLLSGAICGLAGFLFVSGSEHTLDMNLDRGRGFTAIIVSWMAHFNPLYMILTSLLVVFLQRGSEQIASANNLNLSKSYADIVTGIIILFIIGCEFFINYKLKFKSKKEEA